MRVLIVCLSVLLLNSCRKSLVHERWISNASNDTVYVWNPDFEDTTYIIAPAQKAMIYSYEILDKDQPSEACAWMGDTLFILNSKDSICEKPVSRESNWFSNVIPQEKKTRKQICTFTVYDDSF